MGGHPLTRRTVLRSLGAAGLGAASAGFLGSCARETEPLGPHGLTGGGPAEALERRPGELMIVGLSDFSGAAASEGRLVARGERLAIEERHEVLGMQLGHQPIDTHGDPREAVRRAQQALSTGKELFTGAVLPRTAAALSTTINAHGGVFTTAGGATAVSGSQCRSSTFHWAVPPHGIIERTVVPLLTSDAAPQRWYTVTPETPMGKALLEATKQQLRAHGAEHVDNSFHPPDEKSFTEYVQHAGDTNPDMLLLLNHGSQAGHALKAATTLGLKEHTEICVAHSTGMPQFGGLAPGIVTEVHAGAQYWHDTDTTLNREFVSTATKLLGHPPGDAMAAGYACTKLLLDGIEHAGNTEPADVIAALEGYEYEGLTGSEKVRGADHQVIKNYYLLRGKPEPVIDDAEIPVAVVSSGKTFRKPSAKNCTLTPLGQR